MEERKWTAGQKVAYRSFSGLVLGKVERVNVDGRALEWRVTSRRNSVYPRGTLVYSSASNPWLRAR